MYASATPPILQVNCIYCGEPIFLEETDYEGLGWYHGPVPMKPYYLCIDKEKTNG